jgi:hypothetical protein
MTEIVLPKGSGERREELLLAFARQLEKIQEQVPFRISSRGWCYQLEGFNLISKGDFSKVEGAINECRAAGYLPIDFTAEEEGRKFRGVEIKRDDTPAEYISMFAAAMEHCERHYTPDWWVDERFAEQDHEEYYIQMLVEKIDLVSLFEPVTKEYKIPIATSKGWSSMLQRAEYARRFKDAEDRGLTCVLLYCGDFDADGLRISERLRKNLDDLKNIIWHDGTEGYDPENLIIDRFGLNYKFILANNLSWIDNKDDVAPYGVPKLITGSGKNLASPSHKNFHMEYVQSYISSYGVRKCEANALVIRPDQARGLCRGAIIQYLGIDATNRFQKKEETKNGWFDKVRKTITVGNLCMADAVEEIQKGLDAYDKTEVDEE